MKRNDTLKSKDDLNQCRIIVTGDELVELQRHAHEIPECPGLDRRIQKYKGTGALKLSRDELEWLVAVLDAVLHHPKGYPCVQWEPWKLEYVPTTDARCVACQRLYDRLDSESERLSGLLMKLITGKAKPKRMPGAKEAKDLPKLQIEAVFKKLRCPAIVCRINRGYTILHDNMAISRIRERRAWWEVLWWSHRDKWESIGDMGGIIFDTVEEAAEYVVKDPMGVFWR